MACSRFEVDPKVVITEVSVGSDFPEIGLPEAVSRASALLDSVGADVRDRIMCGNIDRFLNGEI